MTEKPCPNCDRIMRPRTYATGRQEWPSEFSRRVYCSRRCAYEGHRLPVQLRSCQGCGQPMDRKRRPCGLSEKRPEYNERRFCSQACRMAHSPGNQRKDRHAAPEFGKAG